MIFRIAFIVAALIGTTTFGFAGDKGGNDTLTGGAGQDKATCCKSGNDTLDGGAGND